MALTLDEYLALPFSKKITLLEIDSPLDVIWLNYSPGRWFTVLTPGEVTDTDDFGNVAFWGDQNKEYYNIGSLSVMGEQYTEAASFAAWESGSTKLWFYDGVTGFLYLTLENWDPPESVLIIKPGAIIGFSNQVDVPANNTYGGVYYEPILNSLPSLTKKKDPLFFGILSYQGGAAGLDNTGGLVDNLVDRGLFGQPLRVRLTFEGLPYDESLIVYTARAGKITSTWEKLNINITDVRRFLKRKLPVNVFDSTTYPSMDSKLIGIPIPINFGPAIKAPAYKVSSNTWVFADVEFNNIDSGITVYNPDDTIFNHIGTGVNGNFTATVTTWNSGTAYSIGDIVTYNDVNFIAQKAGTNHIPDSEPEYWKKLEDDKFTVSYTQGTIENGLDVIADILENYENIPFDAVRYDTTEWNAEKTGVKDTGLWLGQGNLLNSADVIAKICTENQGIFEVLADGRFTFRTLDPNATPVAEIELDENNDPPRRTDDPTEVLSSVKIEYSENIRDELFQFYTNTDFLEDVYAEFESYNERIFRTNLISEADAILLSDDIMALSKTIFPEIDLNTKTQYIELRILDLVLFTYQRVDGKILIPRSRYQVLNLAFDLMAYEISIGIKQIAEDDTIYS